MSTGSSWLALFSLGVAIWAFVEAIKSRRRYHRYSKIADDYVGAVAIIAVFARGPELPPRAYRHICRQYLAERQIEADIQVVEQGGGSEAVH